MNSDSNLAAGKPPDRANILGISAFYHDSAACLVQQGRLIAAAQEERFTRKKHDANFPRHAVDYCLREGGITIREVDFVAFYEKRWGANKWPKGTLLNLAIGQGELLITPLQLAMMAAQASRDGEAVRPHVVQSITGVPDYKPEKPDHPGYAVHEEIWKAVREGLRRVVDSGTATMAQVPGVAVGGKTGTAQNPSGVDHALFICYAPIEKPTIAIAVVVENGGHGGSTAAPIAQKGLTARLAPELYLAQKREAARADSLLLAHGGPRPAPAPPRAAVPDSLLGD